MLANNELGLVAKLESDPTALISGIRELGFGVAHISVYDPSYATDEVRDFLIAELKKHDVRVDAVWAGWPGKVVWDFIEGPTTTGLVPPDLREERAAIVKQTAGFAKALGADIVMTHPGFLPEDPNEPKYRDVIPVFRDIAAHCASLGQQFCFETGQTTPITMLRTIVDIGMDNVGINFDPANLLHYGKGNPVDAVDTLAPWIRGVHIKDARYPTNGNKLGEEMPLGTGQVDFPAFLNKIDKLGYSGPLCIETEIGKEERPAAVLAARKQLESWLGR